MVAAQGKRTLVGRGSGTGRRVPLNAWDEFIGPVHTRKAYFYRQTLDGDALRRSLDRVLQTYPTLAGRLVRRSGSRLEVDASGQGAEFSEHRVAEPFPWAAGHPADKIAAGPYLSGYALRVTNHDAPLLRVKLTHFAGGGSVLGVGNTHCVMDDEATSRFLMDWARVHAGEFIEPIEEDRLSVERFADGRPVSATSPDMELASLRQVAWTVGRAVAAFPRLCTRAWRLPRTLLDELRQRCTDDTSTRRVSTNDALTAALWRTIGPIRSEQGQQRLNMIVDARRRAPFASGLFANACVGPVHAYAASEVTSLPLPTLAARVRGLIDTVDARYISDAISFMRERIVAKQRWRMLPLGLRGVLDGGLMFDSWARSCMYEMDFGAGPACWMDVPRLPLPGLIIPTPDPEGDGLVVHVSLLRSEWRRVDAAAPTLGPRQGQQLLRPLLD